jgi:hypothetical protein
MGCTPPTAITAGCTPRPPRKLQTGRDVNRHDSRRIALVRRWGGRYLLEMADGVSLPHIQAVWFVKTHISPAVMKSLLACLSALLSHPLVSFSLTAQPASSAPAWEVRVWMVIQHQPVVVWRVIYLFMRRIPRGDCRDQPSNRSLQKDGVSDT